MVLEITSPSMFNDNYGEISCSWILAGLLLLMGLLFLWLYQIFWQRQRRLQAEIGKEERREAQLWVEIDRRREVEAHLEAYKVQLEEMVAERTRALEASQNELFDQALELGRAQLAALVLHNIGNAMTPVTIFVEELKEDDSARLLGYLANCFAEFKEHAVDLGSFVNDDEHGRKLFAYSGELLEELVSRQPERERQITEIEVAVNRVAEILLLQQNYSGGFRECRSQVDCNVVIEDALQVLEGSFAKRKIDIKKNLETPAPPLFVDRDSLLQVFVHLIKNGFEAIDKKLATGSDEMGERVLTLASRVENRELRVTFGDSGIGISADELEHIFTFGHSDKGASGFGLYYCKQWVERNRGTITMVSSGPGLGARVEICLPVSRGDGDVSAQDNPDC